MLPETNSWFMKQLSTRHQQALTCQIDCEKAQCSGSHVESTPSSLASTNDTLFSSQHSQSFTQIQSFTPEQKQMEMSPLTAVIATLHLSRRMLFSSQDANALLSTYVNNVLTAHPNIQPVFSTLGWVPGFGFTRPVDVLGLSWLLKRFKYRKVSELGCGSYGVVFKATDIDTGDVVALKKMVADLDGDHGGFPVSTLREVSILRKLNHPNLVRLRDVIGAPGSPHMYLVLDCMDTDLRAYALESLPVMGPMQVSIIKNVMYQALQGVSYLHANGVIHRDLKPHNILIDRTSKHIKIADYGLARAYVPPARPYTPKVVTVNYRAPELLLGVDTYDQCVDMWSMGCIMAELLAATCCIFMASTEVGVIMEMFKVLGTPTEEQWPGSTEILHRNFGGPCPQMRAQNLCEVIPYLAYDPMALDLLSSMLRYDPNQRISAAAALRHPWFRSALPATLPTAAHSQ